MLEHASYLENVVLRPCHNAVQTLSATLVGTDTAKILDSLKETFGIDLPSKDEEDDVGVESASEEDEQEQQAKANNANRRGQRLDGNLK